MITIDYDELRYDNRNNRLKPHIIDTECLIQVSDCGDLLDPVNHNVIKYYSNKKNIPCNNILHFYNPADADLNSSMKGIYGPTDRIMIPSMLNNYFSDINRVGNITELTNENIYIEDLTLYGSLEPIYSRNGTLLPTVEIYLKQGAKYVLQKEYYFKDNALHRICGPAIYDYYGPYNHASQGTKQSKRYYIRGKIYNKDCFEKLLNWYFDNNLNPEWEINEKQKILRRIQIGL